MGRERSYHTEGIVLRRTEAGEADRIVTFLTPDRGKVRALARAVRRPRSKLACYVEMFTHSSLMLAHGKNLDILAQGQVINSFLPLKSDLKRSACAFYLAELVSRFTAEHMENAALFDLLESTFRGLCVATSTDLLLRHFEVNLLHCQGYRPNLRRCTGCNALLRPRANWFSASAGGILCPACFSSEPVARPISVDAIKVLRHLLATDYATASKLRIGRTLAGELEQLLRDYIEHVLERKVQSATWLDRVNREVAASPASCHAPSDDRLRANRDETIIGV